MSDQKPLVAAATFWPCDPLQPHLSEKKDAAAASGSSMLFDPQVWLLLVLRLKS